MKTIFYWILCVLFLPICSFAQTSEGQILKQYGELQDQTAVDSSFAEFITELTLDPNNPAIHLKLADLYYKHGMYELAIVSYRRVLQFNPQSAVSHHGLSLVFRKKSMKAYELSEMETAVSLDPLNPQLVYELGVLYMEPETYDYKKAKKTYQALVKLNSPLLTEKLGKLVLIE